MPEKKSSDPMTAFTEAMQSMPIDMSALYEQMKSSAAIGEQLAKVALEAAERSNAVSSEWAKQTISNVGSVSKMKEDPTEFGKAITDFASSQGELASKNMSAFAEIAKTVQAQTIALMMDAGKSMGAEAAEAMQKAQEQLMSISKKGK